MAGAIADALIAEAIPISARLMTIADVFDALISRRVYKEAMPIDDEIIASDTASSSIRM